MGCEQKGKDYEINGFHSEITDEGEPLANYLGSGNCESFGGGLLFQVNVLYRNGTPFTSEAGTKDKKHHFLP